MAKLLKILNPEISAYKDRRFPGDEQDWERAMRTSTTVYVGNLSFYTREEQVYEVFSKVGHIKQIVMGLDKFQKTPCGFCFVVYYLRRDAEACVKYVNGLMLDERPIRVDFDWGYIFENKRQFGRGRSGGQVRDEFRKQNDPERGGLGRVAWEQQVAAQMQHFGMVQPHEGAGAYDSGTGNGQQSGYVIREGREQDRRPAKRQHRVDEQQEEQNPRFRKDASDDEDGH